MEEEIKEELWKINSELSDIRKLISAKNKAKADKYDELIERLKKVRIKVKDISSFVDDMGRKCIKVSYEVPTGYLVQEDNGEFTSNETLRYINLLDLISLEDMRKIQDEIEKNKESVKK